VTSGRRTEAELVAAFLGNRQLTDGHAVLLHEFETLAGIPDVVLVDVHAAGTTDTVESELMMTRMVTNGHASVLSALHRRAWRRMEPLSEATGLALNYTRRIVAELKALGLVELSPSGAVRLSEYYRPPRIRFTAMEFKLSDWRRALAQALRHRSFAAVTVVVMPPTMGPALQAASAVFREYGVGSAVFDPEDMRFVYVVKPRIRTPTSSRVYLDAVGRAALRGENRASVIGGGEDVPSTCQ
jgi:hypothetical protein